MNLTVDRARELLNYDPSTGLFTWRVSRSTRLPGSPAGSVDKDGYICIRVDGKTYKAHRLAWFMVYAAWPLNQIDHLNRVKSDNRIDNLRDVPQSMNQRNRPVRSDSQSGVTGVIYHVRYGKWYAHINDDTGQQLFLGFFDDFDDAVVARRDAEIKYGYTQ